MRKFKILNAIDYIDLTEGETYSGDFKADESDLSVLECFELYPEDWEEVFECESNWISVNNRLPTDYCGAYLVIDKRGCMAVCGFDSENWYPKLDGRYPNFNSESYTHWMSLPDPPKQ